MAVTTLKAEQAAVRENAVNTCRMKRHIEPHHPFVIIISGKSHKKRQTRRQTEREKDRRQTDRGIDRRTDGQTASQADGQTDRQTGRDLQTNRTPKRKTDR